MTDEDVARAIDAHEAAALADTVSALPPSVAAELGASVEEVDGATAITVAATGNAYLNRVVGLGVFAPTDRDVVRRLVERYRERDTAFLVHVSPLSRPAQLSDWLREEGLEPEPNWVAIYRGAEPLDAADPGFRIERAQRKDAAVFARTLCEGYGMPDEWAPLWEHVVGRERWMNWLLYDSDSELPVATGSLFVDQGRARMCNGSTLRSHRRRGIHLAFLRYRIACALDAGCTLVTGETWEGSDERPNPARRTHAHLGIRTAYVRRNYVFRPY
jgi:hypothetical protein